MRLSALPIVLCLLAPTAAQSHVTSPPGYLSSESVFWSGYFGEFSNLRYMFFDGEFRNRALTIKEIAYRHDSRRYEGHDGYGRTWRSVTLDMAPCNMAAVSTVFSLNPTTTPTRVFSGSVTWARISGYAPTLPAAWGAGGLRFPFRTTFTHTGRQDFCMDYRFVGGTMANSANWPSSASRQYTLDCPPGPVVNAAPIARRGLAGVNRGCKDTKGIWNEGAFGLVESYTHGPSHSTQPNRFRLVTTSYFTGRHATVLHAMSAAGVRNGLVHPAVPCNRLYLDPRSPWLFRFAKPWGFRAIAKIEHGVFPYQAAAVGTPIWMQPAWADLGNGALRLGAAVESSLVGLPRAFKRSVLVAYPTATVGYGPRKESYHNPTARYTR